MLNVAALSIETLAGILEQSVDCVKLIAPDGAVRWMNPNGLCAMEIDAFAAIAGRQWSALWPDLARPLIANALATARPGQPVRFDAFCPTARGAARWWNVTVSVVAGTSGEPLGFLAVSRDVTDAEAAREALEIAVAEMRHRLKNTYAMIGSLLLTFSRGETQYEDFAHAMNSRLVMLSAAQTLFVDGDAPTAVAQLIPALALPFDSTACPVRVGMLPDAELTRGEADAVALVFGELAVNSAKHGALSAGGTIDVATDDGPGVAIVWRETSNKPVVARSRDGGQGLRLIDRIVRARGGTIAVEWRADGLTFRLAFSDRPRD